MAVSTPDNEHQARDERRAQLIGAAWLAAWKRGGRGRSQGMGLWIRNTIAPREDLKYEWIWIEPYLTNEAGEDVDTYRGQQAGRALLDRFAEAVDATSAYWFEEAKKLAEATQEEWLFLTGIMQTDGWVQKEGKNAQEQPFTAWTKSAG